MDYLIKSKIYYDIVSGEVLLIIPEKNGLAEDDYISNEALNGRHIEEVDFIELQYGTLTTTFTNYKSYKVNVKTKQLEVIYYTEEELTAMQQQNQEIQDLNSRVLDISTYLSSLDSLTIVDIENSILEIEKNKIIIGGM